MSLPDLEAKREEAVRRLNTINGQRSIAKSEFRRAEDRVVSLAAEWTDADRALKDIEGQIDALRRQEREAGQP